MLLLLLLVEIGIFIGLCVLLLLLVVLRSNLEQIIVFFVDVAYLPVLDHLRLLLLVVTLQPTELQGIANTSTVKQHRGWVQVVVGCAQGIVGVVDLVVSMTHSF